MDAILYALAIVVVLAAFAIATIVWTAFGREIVGLLVVLASLAIGIYFGVQLGGFRGGVLIVTSPFLGAWMFAGVLELSKEFRAQRK